MDAVATTLGPRGMDKLIVDGHGTNLIVQCRTLFSILFQNIPVTLIPH